MKIELKLGAVSVAGFVEEAGAKLFSLSDSAPSYEISRITNEISEIKANSLFVIGEDNSLAEMMAASKNGAKCVICTREPQNLEKIPETAVIVCDNINRTIDRFAKQYVKRNNHKTIALTGSKGKTRTGEFVYSVLEEMYKVHKATDNKSTEKNDSYSLFDIAPNTDFFLVELKIREKKDISRLAGIFESDVGIITSLNSCFDNNANVDVLAGLKSGGEIAFCAEDEVLSLLCRSDITAKSVSVKNADAELYAKKIREYKGRTVFDIVGQKGICIENVEIHFEGLENVQSALFAALVGLKYGVPADKIRTGLKNYHSSELGVEIYTVGGVTFIVDASSATEDSVRSAVDTLCDIAKLHKKSRKIAIIGDIRDFGQDTRATHEKMGEYIFDNKIDKLYTFGVAAEQIGVGAKRVGMPEKDISGNLELFSPIKTAKSVAEELRSGDILLIRMGRRNAAIEIEQYLRERLEK